MDHILKSALEIAEITDQAGFTRSASLMDDAIFRYMSETNTMLPMQKTAEINADDQRAMMKMLSALVTQKYVSPAILKALQEGDFESVKDQLGKMKAGITGDLEQRTDTNLGMYNQFTEEGINDTVRRSRGESVDQKPLPIGPAITQEPFTKYRERGNKAIETLVSTLTSLVLENLGNIPKGRRR